ncbi:endonuclease/exonuclease/phosphatase family protein [Parapedobacter koreensis]|uniref:Metal-dependent hydrolase, endonuclease/exonuclease/phosphatase family n=1 Tax=Parapedobacter koreensis TaxID=332977 RepID=A0A1H7Q5D5_9SPHI|nr:endonuclease/exonuclease/phosphatase family protein [Parapedobacter koreensis]SEL43371.1 Metal-dependent hydrolase, endonuclease/exonuclease/phosphatase family [Parapedobacter koreensis]
MVSKPRRKKALNFFGKSVLFANFLAVLALLLSYSAPFINPKAFWPSAFFGIAYLPLLIINIVFIVYWLTLRARYAAISFLAILLGWGTLSKHVGFNSKVPEAVVATPDAAHVRLLTYNVHFFRAFEQQDTELTIWEDAMKLMDSISPDVICIQEYYTRQKGRYKMVKEFERKIKTPYHYISPTAENEYEAYGIAIFSRYPIVASGYLPQHELGVNRIIYADIDKGGKIFRVYNVHLRSFGFQKEDYDFIKRPSKTIEKDAASTRRIGSRLKHAFNARSDQAEILREHSRACETPYIIAGDFNDTPLSYSVNKVSAGLQNAFHEKGRGWGVTYNGDFPNFQIDYILASKEFKIHHYQIIKAKLSDHYPVWADVQF